MSTNTNTTAREGVKAPLSLKWLEQFRKSSQIVRTGRDDKGNYYNSTGQLNQAAWFGEHGHLLLDEIDRLRAMNRRY